MKPLFIAICMALALSGCSKSPEQELLDIIGNATGQMQSAKTIEEANKANNDFNDAITEFEKKNGEAYKKLENDKEKSAAIRAALQNYTSVGIQKFIELGSQ